MAKQKRPPVMVDLGDGIERQIKYTCDIVEEIERKYGAFQTMLKEHAAPKLIPDLIWLGLVDKTDMDRPDPLTLEDIRRMIEYPDLEDLGVKFMMAYLGKTESEVLKAAEAAAAKNVQSQAEPTQGIALDPKWMEPILAPEEDSTGPESVPRSATTSE